MITVYRIGKKKYTHDPLGGSGGLIVGGRWHQKGARIVYSAQSLSLASLEFFVHFQRVHSAIELVSFDIKVPNSLIEVLPATLLPKDWNATPAVSAVADIGNTWLVSARSAVLCVPSALTPGEFNYLINPAHADFGQIKVTATTLFHYDSRLWK